MEGYKLRKKSTPIKGKKVQKRLSPMQDKWLRFQKNKPAMFALVILVVIILSALFANQLFPYEEITKTNVSERLQSPSLRHLLGTDALGRDLLGRIIHGARISLTLAVCASFTILLCGCLIGSFAAFIGGLYDITIMRICDLFLCIPGTLLTLTILIGLGGNIKTLFISMVIGGVPGCAIYMRSIFLNIARQDYIEAARAQGVRTLRTLLVHIVPNAVGLIVVNTTMNISGLIMTVAGLSFIGMGLQPPTPDWGAMVSESRQFMRTQPYLAIIPSAALAITSMALNLFGDGLSDAIDPRNKG